MTGNNNKKFIRTLSYSSLKANKNRNLIAVLAIVLTAALFMALVTVYEGSQLSMQEQRLREAGTRFMVSVKGLSEEEAKILMKNPVFSLTGMERFAASAANPELKSMRTSVGWVSETVAENSFMKLEKGVYPAKENELACDSEVLRLLGLPEEIGTVFTLEYRVEDQVLSKEMKITGIWKGKKYEQSATLLVSQAFVEEALETCTDEESRSRSYNVRADFKEPGNISKQLQKVVEELGYNPHAKRGEEGFLIHHVKPVYAAESGVSKELLLGGIFIVALILLASYLIIYNIFKISVEKDIRLYGQLKTIGTSPKQIRYMIRRQGMLLSVVGIPVGLAAGCLLGNGFLPLVLANTMAQEAVFLAPRPWIWAVSALFTLLTVRISCSRPGKIAGRISPVEALKYHGERKSGKKQKRGKATGFPIAALAFGNLGRSKGKTCLVVLSLSLSMVLLNGILNFTGCMDQETYVQRNTASDFDVRSSLYLQTSSEESQKVVSDETAEFLKALPGVEDYGQVYLRMVPEEENTEENTEEPRELGRIIKRNGQETPKNPAVYDRNHMLFGYDENILKRVKVIEGELDYEKLCTGNYVVMMGFEDDSGNYIADASNSHAGDRIELEIEGQVKEYTVLAVVSAKAALVMSNSAGNYEAVVLAESVFLQMFPENKNPIHCIFDAAEGSFEELNDTVTALADSGRVSALTRLTEEEEFCELKDSYNIIGGIVSVIFGFIGFLNLVNVIFTGMLARQREFASMRSIGMTRKQLQRLLIYEGVSYALLAGVVSILLGGLVSLTAVRVFAEANWFTKYEFTVLPAAAAAFVCLLLAAGTSAVTDKLWNKGSAVEQLRQ